jgi:hypothetical protein
MMGGACNTHGVDKKFINNCDRGRVKDDIKVDF